MWAKAQMGISSSYVKAQVLSKLLKSRYTNATHFFFSNWFPRVSATEQTSLQNIRYFFERRREKNSFDSFWRFQKKHISVSWWRRLLHPFSLEPKCSAFFFRQIKITDKVVKMSFCVTKCGSDEEQLSWSVGSQPTLSPSCCPLPSSEPELSSPEVRFSGCCGTDRSSLCGTGFIADGKSEHFTVCLGLEVISVMFVTQT